MQIDPEAALLGLGFTQVESHVYCELLRSAPASGYRLANLVGKAPTNTYAALRTLIQKGAVVSSGGPNEALTYTAIPPAQLLSQLRSTSDQRFDAALTALEGVYVPAKDENFYQLKTVPQVMERMKAMLAAAREIVLFDFFPEFYDLFRAEFDELRARGVMVAGLAYRPDDALPTMPYNDEGADLVRSRWPGLGATLIVDGSQQLVAQVSRDQSEVLSAVYSANVLMSCIFHSSLAADIRLSALLGDPSDPLKILSLQRSVPPGLRTILGIEPTAPKPAKRKRRAAAQPA